MNKEQQIAPIVWAKLYPERRPFAEIAPEAREEWETMCRIAIDTHEAQQWHGPEERPEHGHRALIKYGGELVAAWFNSHHNAWCHATYSDANIHWREMPKAP